MSFRDRLHFKHLAAATSLGTFVLILLGVYTGATGSGLACSAQWPLCDNGLLPQSLPSFIEWLHRLIAMLVGFMILGLAYGGWRGYEDRRIRVAVTVALVSLPVQVLLGRGTVVQYTPEVQTAHHAVALVIFSAVLAATLWIYEAER